MLFRSLRCMAWRQTNRSQRAYADISQSPYTNTHRLSRAFFSKTRPTDSEREIDIRCDKGERICDVKLTCFATSGDVSETCGQLHGCCVFFAPTWSTLKTHTRGSMAGFEVGPRGVCRHISIEQKRELLAVEC